MRRVLYAYLDITNPMVAWEVAIGRLQSVGGYNQFGVSLWFYNLMNRFISSNDAQKAIYELKLELIRQHYYPEKVSRLKGVYFFETKEMAEMALQRWGMQRHNKFITEVEFFGDNFTSVDSEWITSCLGNSESVQDDWMHKYWSGDTMWSNPLTEVLASGFGLVHDKQLRSLAIEQVYNSWPTSSILLNASIAGFALRNFREICRIKPAITMDDGIVEGKYYIDMNEFNNNQPQIIEAMKEMFADGCNLINIIPDHGKGFTVPNLSQGFFTSTDSKFVDLFRSIHEH